ncbi:conserved Plasmodium protein, unknown function [Plasmodium malariae]|uniref:Uncharacterized protein n=1 Tax=Plasmodium malariae TaxID=5858 RepID=A0A1C3KY67_PLAMA|nr:conserved Plasmodium protein, unknown function [Plasmodium malariae]
MIFLNKADSLLSEKEIIENNKIQQIKILASSKLIELHKAVQRILLLATKNREKRKIEIKIKLEELKKIIEVCKKDCDITLNDAKDSKTHIENVYVKEVDVRTSDINKTQELINQVKNSLDQLIIKKNELYNEYQLICKEINKKNKELSKVLSTLSLYKKELNEAENNYLNKLSNTSKTKHMHQERKLYISNLDNMSDEILKEYEKSEYVNTDELVSKSIKIKKPLKQVITKHLTYLKDKLCLLNTLLKFYAQKVTLLLKNTNNAKKGISKLHHLDHCNTIDHHNNSDPHNIADHHNGADIHNNVNFHSDVDHHSDDDVFMKKNEMVKDDHIKKNILNTTNNEDFNQYNHYEKERKSKLLKYKKCYFKVTEQINKVWIIIQEFYDLHKEQIDEDNDEVKYSAHFIYDQINIMYNYSKKFIMENSPIISSIS